MSIGLTSKEDSSRDQGKLLYQALNLAKVPIIIAYFLTPIRFLLELAGLPENIIFIFGLLWLTLVFAVHWGVKIYHATNPYLLLLLSLIIFSPISRLTVFMAWFIDKKWEIGTHYGLYFDSWTQALLNQVVYGALVQIIPGFLLGAIILAIVQHRKSVNN
jgi:hypothetical protein